MTFYYWVNKSSFNILDINPLSNIWFANIFPLFKLSFHFLEDYEAQQVLILMQFNLTVLAVVAHGISRNCFLRSQIFSPTFFLTVLSNLSSILYIMWREVLFHSWHMNILLSQNQLLKRLFILFPTVLHNQSLYIGLTPCDYTELMYYH